MTGAGGPCDGFTVQIFHLVCLIRMSSGNMCTLSYRQPVFEGLWGQEHQLLTADDKDQIINYSVISVGYLPVFLSALLQDRKH